MDYRIGKERNYYTVIDRKGTVLRTADTIHEAEEEAENLRKAVEIREADDGR